MTENFEKHYRELEQQDEDDDKQIIEQDDNKETNNKETRYCKYCKKNHHIDEFTSKKGVGRFNSMCTSCICKKSKYAKPKPKRIKNEEKKKEDGVVEPVKNTYRKYYYEANREKLKMRTAAYTRKKNKENKELLTQYKKILEQEQATIDTKSNENNQTISDDIKGKE
jgi:hypothetical protein